MTLSRNMRLNPSFEIMVVNMKANTSRLLLVLIFCIAATSAHAQYITIPDIHFGTWLNAHGYSACLTGGATAGWRLDTTCSKLAEEDAFYCDEEGISDLTGIKYFKGLSELHAGKNKLRTLPELPHGLTWISVSGNQLRALPDLPPMLNCLHVSDNKLTSIPSLPKTMKQLVCDGNQIELLPALTPQLMILDCGSNPLTALPPLPASLQALKCPYTKLASLPDPLPGRLAVLHCRGNGFKTLPAIPAEMGYLDVSCNPIDKLPALPNTLRGLKCDSIGLTALSQLPDSLWELSCCGNTQLSSLPPMAQNHLFRFFIKGTAITCLAEAHTAAVYDTDPQKMPVCAGSNPAIHDRSRVVWLIIIVISVMVILFGFARNRKIKENDK